MTTENYSLILNNIKRYVDLNAVDEEQLVSIIKPLRVKKRQFIVQPNFVCTHQSFIVKGAFRSYFVNDEGIEHTIQFAVEDWFISDFNSYIFQEPAQLFIEALEDGIINQLGYDDVENLCKVNPKFEHYFRVVAQKAFAFSQRRVLSNLNKSAKERYLEFQSLYPDIVSRVPQYSLASYLGMTPEFLSKIRRSIATKS